MNVKALLQNFNTFSSDIKLSHSLFSFPFVGASIIIAGYSLNFSTLLLILLSLTTARSFAMGMNRYLDQEMDRKNPRTKGRALPSKKISSHSLLLWTLTSGFLFILFSTFYNKLTFYSSVPLLIILGLYPLTKKWTWLCHIYLGFCLSLSPIAASIAIDGSVPLSSYLIAGAILFWVAGFDIIYATQDYHFDKKEKINSIPSFFGIKKALKISQIFFILMITLLLLLGFLTSKGTFYYLGLLVVSSVLFYEHYSLSVKEEYNEVHIEPIFFTANAWISVLYFVFVSFDHFL